MENTETNKSIESLQTERAELLKKLDEIKSLTNKENDDKKADEALSSLRAENESLKKLIEEYKADISNATKFAQQVMLEYGSRKEEKNIQQTTSTTNDPELEDAQKALDMYMKNKMEEMKDDK